MKRAYAHDLKALAAVCEHNFARLRRLLPGFAADAVAEFRIPAGQAGATHMTLRVVERFRYTATVDLVLQQKHLPKAFSRQTFRVRVYLDANTSEVVSQGQTGSYQGVYPYPNPRMYQSDEKTQLNRWLGEWLQALFTHGTASASRVFG